VDDNAAVIGGGTMGAGIAHALASAGFETWLVEVSPERQEAVTALLSDVVEDGVRRGKVPAEQAASVLARLHLVDAVDDVPIGCALVVESVPERFDLKVEVLRAAEKREPAILSSNTSALSIEELAAELAHPERFLGTHFFNPVWALHLVELVTAGTTSAQTLERAVALGERLGKQVAVVRDSPGFATSRLDLVTGLEAMRMVEEGVASPEDIDRAMTTAYRHPVGPLRLADIVGLDVRLDISRGLEQALGPRFAPPQLLVDMVARGDLGQKSGRGFYDWS
jgi:3-hydroxybutyryl-CoA dehydrogenase